MNVSKLKMHHLTIFLRNGIVNNVPLLLSYGIFNNSQLLLSNGIHVFNNLSMVHCCLAIEYLTI